MKKRDIFVVTGVIAVAVMMLLMGKIAPGEGERVVIYVNSEIYKTVSIKDDCEIRINETNTLAVENGEAYMREASCPDKLCVRQGKISREGQNIVCLPNRVSVKVEK